MKYQPHEYQRYATDFIIQNPTAAVFLEMGLGKSIITLTALFELCLDRFEIGRVLVIAPLRVARDTWPAEIEKWDHLHGLTYSVAVGLSLIHIYRRGSQNDRYRNPCPGSSYSGSWRLIDSHSGRQRIHSRGAPLSAAHPRLQW